MTLPPEQLDARHHEVEERFRALLDSAGLPEPDDVAHLRDVVIFLWSETKAVVLIDLDEAPEDDPFYGLDFAAIAADIAPTGRLH